MILLAALLGSIGLADLARTRFHSSRTLWIPAVLGIVAFGVAALGTGQDGWWVLAGAAAIVGWTLATRENGDGHRAGYWAVGGLAIAVAAAFAWGARLPRAAGPIVDWYEALPYSALDRVDFVTFALTVGLALFLVESANVAVRLALRGERAVEPADAETSAAASAPLGLPAKRRWWRREPRSPAPVAPPPRPAFTELKGGRFIGPLERLFLLTLLLTGDFTALAAVIAAKGIVRFPEISKDATGGSKAEYFLVGSFASWALVMVAALLIVLGPTTS